MKISTKGRYALKVMIDLCDNKENTYISLKDIAIKEDVSVKYLEQIVAMLNKAGFVEAVRGNNGGYKLTKKPSEYTVGDILRATEGKLTPTACVGSCQKKECCKTFEFWNGLDVIINNYVDSKTLEDLIK